MMDSKLLFRLIDGESTKKLSKGDLAQLLPFANRTVAAIGSDLRMRCRKDGKWTNPKQRTNSEIHSHLLVILAFNGQPIDVGMKAAADENLQNAEVKRRREDDSRKNRMEQMVQWLAPKAKAEGGATSLSEGENMTQPLTKSAIADAFKISRHNVDRDILEVKFNVPVGRKFQLRVADMPASYRAVFGQAD